MKLSLWGRDVIYRKFKSFFRRLKSEVNSVLFILACHGPIVFIAQLILRRRNWQPVEIHELTEATSDASLMLAETGPYEVEAPRWIGKTPTKRIGTFPPVLAHVFNDGITTAYSPAVLRAGKLYLPKQVYEQLTRILTDSAGLFQIGRRFSVGRILAECSIPKGIVTGGAGSFNWYHFVIECLPKAFLARSLPSEFDDFPLVVPDECRRIPSFTTALDIFSANRPIRFLRRGELALVRRLVVMDEISIGPFNLSKGEWPRIDDYRQHNSVVKAFISEFRSKLLANVSSMGSGRRIFLKRPGERRNYNQDELIEIARRYGFEPVTPELLSLQDQATTFAEASAVIGPSGAAWVGMIFREQPLLGLSWLPLPYEYFCSYSALANLIGHRLEFIVTRTQQVLRSTGEAYMAEYQVCPVEFENALKNMTSDLQK